MDLEPARFEVARDGETLEVDGFRTDVAGVVVSPYLGEGDQRRWVLVHEPSGFVIPPASFATAELAADFAKRIGRFRDWTGDLDAIVDDVASARRVQAAWFRWVAEGT